MAQDPLCLLVRRAVLPRPARARWPIGWSAGGATASTSTATRPTRRSSGRSRSAGAWTRHVQRRRGGQGAVGATGRRGWNAASATPTGRGRSTTPAGPGRSTSILGRSAGLGSNLFAAVAYPRRAASSTSSTTTTSPTSTTWPARPGPTHAGRILPLATLANAMDLLDLENGADRLDSDRAGSATCIRPSIRDDFTVLFDGVDARRFAGGRAARVVVGAADRAGDEGRQLRRHARPTGCGGFDRFVELANRLAAAQRRTWSASSPAAGRSSRMLDVAVPRPGLRQRCLDDRAAGSIPSRFWTPGLLRRTSWPTS